MKARIPKAYAQLSPKDKEVLNYAEKKVEIKCTTCQDYAFCDFDKILFHHRSGTPCENYKERK